MGRVRLPKARIEPRGVEGHLAQLKAEARRHGRIARAAGVLLARIVGWTAFTAGTVALLVWLAPPPKSPRLDEVPRIQADFQRYQLNLEASQRALELYRMNDARFLQNTRIDLHAYDFRPFDATAIRAASIPTFDGKAPATKAERAAARAAAVEARRAQRGTP
jgi:hypothetical protein